MDLEKVIKIKCEGKIYRELDEMVPLQGALKSISKENFEKLKNSLVKDGLPLGFHVWLDGKKTFICDGHHRVLAMKSLRAEGYIIPSLPCTPVIANNKKEAAKAVLISNSTYAEMSQDSLSDFMIGFELTFDDMAFLDFSDLNMDDYSITPTDAELPDLDTAEPGFQQRTFILSNEQNDILNEALEKAKKEEDFSDEINQNTNGNMLAAALKRYVYG